MEMDRRKVLQRSRVVKELHDLGEHWVGVPGLPNWEASVTFPLIHNGLFLEK